MSALGVLDFSNSHEEADERANTYERTDPFPDIEPALLSCAEIYDYIRVTALIHPFDKDYLKTAAYEACARGQFRYWDDDKKRHLQIIDDRLPFVQLKPNSISFIQLGPTFRLPYYVGARFNLSIRHVHRGLLLGTGPLIDPGFRGQLLIPLHNLTAEPYELRLDEPLVAIEFTKLRYGPKPKRNAQSLQRSSPPFNKDFPKEKRYQSPRQYLVRANAGLPIVGAMPDAVRTVQKQVERLRFQGVLALIGLGATLLLALAAAVLASFQVAEGTLGISTTAIADVTKKQKDLETLKGEITTLQKQVIVLQQLIERPPGPAKSAEAPTSRQPVAPANRPP